MFEVLRSFFLDGATFKRVVSDAGAIAGLVASVPPAQESLNLMFPGAGWLGPLVVLIGSAYSARARQKQSPPTP